MPERAVVFINPGATYGTGRDRWKRVAAEVERRLGGFQLEETTAPEGLARRLEELVRAGERRFVAAGGDGTVNLLVNAIMGLRAEGVPGCDGVALGAVGLGSSNDFHKPFDERTTVEGMPVRLDFDSARPVDVIRIEYERPGGSSDAHYSLVNASVGVTAEANRRFNEPNWMIRAARAVSVDAAITAAVVTTLAVWSDVTCAVSTDGGEAEMVSVTNLGVFKNPHFGGALCYDTPVAPDDGALGVALCEGMSAAETIATLSALRRCRFEGRRKTRTWTARSLDVRGDRPFALETDGEVFEARGARFGVAPEQLVCAG